MSALTSTDEAARALIPAINHLLASKIAEASEAAIASAVADFETKLRTAIASSALDVARFYELTQQRDNIVITIKDVRRP